MSLALALASLAGAAIESREGMSRGRLIDVDENIPGAGAGAAAVVLVGGLVAGAAVDVIDSQRSSSGDDHLEYSLGCAAARRVGAGAAALGDEDGGLRDLQRQCQDMATTTRGGMGVLTMIDVGLVVVVEGEVIVRYRQSVRPLQVYIAGIDPPIIGFVRSGPEIASSWVVAVT